MIIIHSYFIEIICTGLIERISKENVLVCIMNDVL